MFLGVWYRFKNRDGDADMPEQCVELAHCGTMSPIWLNGAHPTGTTS